MTVSLAESFQQNRAHLRSVAFRMLGSLSEAEDALQDAWLRIGRADIREVQNLGGWMTTVLARVCLDLLRSRRARREQPLEVDESQRMQSAAIDPEDEAMMADSVGYAMLVVLETLTPAERLAFVLHEMFSMSFEEIASIAGRSPEAIRQLASRARKRLRGAPRAVDIERQRATVDAYLSALRANDLPALLQILDPAVVYRADRVLVPAHRPAELQGANASAEQTMALARGAASARIALIDGNVGLLIAPRGKLLGVLQFDFANDRITAIRVVGDRAKLEALELSLLE